MVEGDDKTTKILNSRNEDGIGILGILQRISIIIDCRLMARTYLDPGYHSSKAWSSNWDHPQNAQYLSPKQWVQSSKEFRQASQHAPIAIGIVGSKAKMIGPIERTVLQRACDVLFDSGLKIFNVSVSETGILELADIETELLQHHREA